MSKTVRERASRIVDEIRERLRGLAEVMRDVSGGKQLSPVPVRVDE